MEGLQWRVGNGTKIEVWKDKWVPDSTGFIAPTPPANGLHDNDLVVANLIDYNTSSWNEEELALHFTDEDRDKICNIPLMPQAGDDTLFWSLSVNGSYTVKSAYWLGVCGNVTRQASAINAVWKYIWHLDGPPKLRHFLWRAVSGTLAVKAVLHRRHIVTDPFCQRCHNEEETICHAIMGCCCVKQIWEVSKFWEDIQSIGTDSFAEFFMRLAGKLSQNELSVFAALLWAGWTSRNKALYDDNLHDPQQLASGFVKYTSEYNQYSARVYSRAKDGSAGSSSQWQKPPNGVLKLNVDAAILRDNTVGAGVAARDSEGQLVFTGSKRFKGQWEPCVAEAAAMLYGIELARRLGYSRIWVEGDALGVIQKVQKQHEGYNYVHMFISKIIVQCSSFSLVKFSHVKRGGNCVAHLLARSDVPNNVELVRFDPFPESIQKLAEMDLL